MIWKTLKNKFQHKNKETTMRRGISLNLKMTALLCLMLLATLGQSQARFGSSDHKSRMD